MGWRGLIQFYLLNRGAFRTHKTFTLEHFATTINGPKPSAIFVIFFCFSGLIVLLVRRLHLYYILTSTVNMRDMQMCKRVPCFIVAGECLIGTLFAFCKVTSYLGKHLRMLAQKRNENIWKEKYLMTRYLVYLIKYTWLKLIYLVILAIFAFKYVFAINHK